tara:strand:+ start:1054 stop:1635 length:582 start_codon:yes stop_codon:yes gene_type:complete
MAQSKIHTIPFRRKLKEKTDYKKRLKLLMSGSHRLVVRVSLNNLYVSVNKYSDEGDIVEVNIKSSALKKYGWKADTGNLPSAYLIGFIAGKIAKQKKIEKAILDIGLRSSVKGTRIYAAVAGAIDGGLNIPMGGENLPPKDRLNGTHISKYAEDIKENKEKFESQFGGYIKRDINPVEIHKHFEEVKNKISNS